jgi:hypothetical protein
VSALKTRKGAAAAEQQEENEFVTERIMDEPLDLFEKEHRFLEDPSPWGSASSSSGGSNRVRRQEVSVGFGVEVAGQEVGLNCCLRFVMTRSIGSCGGELDPHAFFVAVAVAVVVAVPVVVEVGVAVTVAVAEVVEEDVEVAIAVMFTRATISMFFIAGDGQRSK